MMQSWYLRYLRESMTNQLSHANLFSELSNLTLRRWKTIVRITSADVLGHRCIDTTFIYAKADLKTLREVSMPWPKKG
jgi:hypothetical protein